MTSQPAPEPVRPTKSGRRPRSREKSRSQGASVTYDDVVGTALKQAGETGLDSISIRSVAAELDISPMTIYRYVASKDDLVDAMLVLALSRMEVPYSSAPDWWERIIDVMSAWRELLLAHPSVIQLLVDRRVPAQSEGLGRLAEHVLACLEDGGVTGRAAAQAFWQIFSCAFGHVVFEHSRRSIDADAQAEAAHAMSSMARLRGFERVECLADELTNITVRGSFTDSLRLLLNGIAGEATR